MARKTIFEFLEDISSSKAKRLKIYKLVLKELEDNYRYAKEANALLTGICYMLNKVVAMQLGKKTFKFDYKLIDYFKELVQIKPDELEIKNRNGYWFPITPVNTIRIEKLKEIIKEIKYKNR